MIDFHNYSFTSVVALPPDYEICDFSGPVPPRPGKTAFSIGKYNEVRPGMYSAVLFGGVRNIHMGIDIGAPVGTSVHAFYEGEIFLFGNNAKPGDYGYTVITKHRLGEKELYALYGHLSARSVEGKKPGQKISAGEIIAWIGGEGENGGWPPHLHFQLSYARPKLCDMPGVVSAADREKSLAQYPDPRLVLGKLY